MKPIVRRSTLIMPVHIPRFVEKAHLRGADAICLDLEDSVPPSEKDLARNSVMAAIPLAGKGGSDVLVRINSQPADARTADIRASVWPGLTGILIPKAESARDVLNVESLVTSLENERGIAKGSVELGVIVETARGVVNALEIATASERITTIGVGDEDLTLDLGINPSIDGEELSYVKSNIIIIARAAGIIPLGLAGTLSDFSDLEGLRRSALKARKIGFKGASGIHPAQIAIMNEVFSPATDDVNRAKRIVEAFQKSLSEGKAAVQLDGKMVDIPVYERAKKTVEWADLVQKVESSRRKEFSANPTQS